MMMTTLNTIKSIASCACPASAVADFYIKSCAGIGRRFESIWDALPAEANSELLVPLFQSAGAADRQGLHPKPLQLPKP